MSVLSNSLADAAETVRELVAASDAAALISHEKFLEAGRTLVDAKKSCPHGDWIPFLARAGVHERKAQRLMKLARSGLKSDTVSDLGGIKGAMQFVSLRERGLAAFGRALEDFAAGGYGIEHVEAALATMDALVLLFPEEKRGPLRRHDPEIDAMQIVESVAAHAS